MSDEESFRSLIGRIRARDERAGAESVCPHEPTIRVAVRVQVSDSESRRWDSMDVCQPVLASFFARAAAGPFELETPDQLLSLLVAMARNKKATYALQQEDARRDQRRLQADAPIDSTLVNPGPSANRVLANRELPAEYLHRLPAAERQPAGRHAPGATWEEIAAEVDEKPDTLCTRFKRPADHVARELNLDD